MYYSRLQKLRMEQPHPGFVICPVCSGLYLNFLKHQHMLGHERRLPVQLCEQCQLAFFRPGDLTRHREEAHGDLMYRCMHCPQRELFNSRGMLHIHLLSHHGIRRKSIEESVIASFAVKGKGKKLRNHDENTKTNLSNN